MLLAARSAFAVRKRLPYDAEVEWLDSGDCVSGDNYNNASVYISTGVAYKPSLKLVLRVLYGTDASINGYTNGIIWQDSNGTSFRWSVSWQPNYYYLSFFTGDDTSTRMLHVMPLVWHDITMTQNKLLCDGNTITSSASPFTPDVAVDVALFARRQIIPALDIDSYSYAQQHVKIAFAKIYDGDVLIRDFIPVRFTNQHHQTEGALYDKVTGKLFRNKGSGSFVLGNDVKNTDYTKLRYLESNGTQYIDTGILTTPSLRFDIIVSGFQDGTLYGAVIGDTSQSTTWCRCQFGRRDGVTGTNQMFASFFKNNNYEKISDVNYSVPHLFSLKDDGFYIDGVNIISRGSSSFEPFYNYFLFASSNTTSGAALLAGSRCHGAWFYKNNNLIAAFIPIRIGTLGYMYDLVSRRVFHNAGTGNFICGPDL